MKPFQAYSIGITGGSGSGKTRLLLYLQHLFEPSTLCIVSQDNYYKEKGLQPQDAQGVLNYDTEHSLDIDAFALDLKSLKEGKEVQKLEYTFNSRRKVPRMLRFKPAPVLIVEGLFLFHQPALLPLLDLKIFVDARPEIRLSRRIKRDATERGYDLNDVLYRYQYHHTPVYDRLIEPLRHDVDLIIPNNHQFEKAADVLAVFIRQKLKDAGLHQPGTP